MSLVKCPDCERSVSDQAPTCPGCGRPMRTASTSSVSAQPVTESSSQGSGGNVVAALASFFIPGLGQLAQGRVLEGIAHFIVCILLWFIWAGWIMHILSAWGAATWRGKEAQEQMRKEFLQQEQEKREQIRRQRHQ